MYTSTYTVTVVVMDVLLLSYLSDCCEIHPKSHNSEDDQSDVECDLQCVFIADVSWERSKTPNGGQESDDDPDGHGLFSLIDGAMSQTESLDLVGNG